MRRGRRTARCYHGSQPRSRTTPFSSTAGKCILKPGACAFTHLRDRLASDTFYRRCLRNKLQKRQALEDQSQGLKRDVGVAQTAEEENLRVVKELDTYQGRRRHRRNRAVAGGSTSDHHKFKTTRCGGRVANLRASLLHCSFFRISMKSCVSRHCKKSACCVHVAGRLCRSLLAQASGASRC